MKVLVIGSYGYGNVGDDTYHFIIREFFDKYDVYDTRYVGDRYMLNIDGSICPSSNFNEDLLWEFDFLIIGGGGVLNERLFCPNNSINQYVKIALKKNIPYYITSVGFQDIERDDPISSIQEKYGLISAIINNSSLTFVRTVDDYFIARSLISDKMIYKLGYYPDLVYALPNFKSVQKHRVKDVILVLYSNWLDVSLESVRKTIKKHKDANPNCKLIFMNWDGFNANVTCNVVEKNVAAIDKYFPGSTIYKGLTMDSRMNTNKLKNACYIDFERDFSLDDAWDIMQRAKYVLTGRYHGVVYAKCSDVPCENIDTMRYNNYKFQADIVSGHQDSDYIALSKRAYISLDRIKNHMEKYSCGDSRLSQPEKWTKHDRNTYIVLASERNVFDVKTVQNWSNSQISDYLKS